MFEIVHQLTNCGTTALITQYNLEPFVPGHVSLPAGGFCIIDQAFKKWLTIFKTILIGLYKLISTDTLTEDNLLLQCNKQWKFHRNQPMGT